MRTMLSLFVVFCRLESSFRSFSRPVLHSAARVVQEMGKSRAAAFALGLQDIDEGAYVSTYSENNDSYDADVNPTASSEGSYTILLKQSLILICICILSNSAKA